MMPETKTKAAARALLLRIKEQHDRYNAGKIDAWGYAIEVMNIAAKNQSSFIILREIYRSGKLMQYFPVIVSQGLSDSELADTDTYMSLAGLVKIEMEKLINDLKSGKISLDAAETRKRDLETKLQTEYDNLSWYQKPLVAAKNAANAISDFFGARWSEAKNLALKVGRQAANVQNKIVDTTARTVNKIVDTGTGLVDKAGDTVSSIGKGIGDLAGSLGYILPVVGIGAVAFLIWKLK